jgi:hypothetical protein
MFGPDCHLGISHDHEGRDHVIRITLRVAVIPIPVPVRESGSDRDRTTNHSFPATIVTASTVIATRNDVRGNLEDRSLLSFSTLATSLAYRRVIVGNYLRLENAVERLRALPD